MIALQGNLRTGSFQDRKHQDVTHYTTDVFVENVEFCGDKGNNSGNQQQPQQQRPQQQQRPPQQQTPAPAQQPEQFSYSNLSDFEEILSDGSDLPF